MIGKAITYTSGGLGAIARRCRVTLRKWHPEIIAAIASCRIISGQIKHRRYRNLSNAVLLIESGISLMAAARYCKHFSSNLRLAIHGKNLWELHSSIANLDYILATVTGVFWSLKKMIDVENTRRLVDKELHGMDDDLFKAIKGFNLKALKKDWPNLQSLRKVYWNARTLIQLRRLQGEINNERHCEMFRRFVEDERAKRLEQAYLKARLDYIENEVNDFISEVKKLDSNEKSLPYRLQYQLSEIIGHLQSHISYYKSQVDDPKKRSQQFICTSKKEDSIISKIEDALEDAGFEIDPLYFGSIVNILRPCLSPTCAHPELKSAVSGQDEDRLYELLGQQKISKQTLLNIFKVPKQRRSKPKQSHWVVSYISLLYRLMMFKIAFSQSRIFACLAVGIALYRQPEPLNLLKKITPISSWEIWSHGSVRYMHPFFSAASIGFGLIDQRSWWDALHENQTCFFKVND